MAKTPIMMAAMCAAFVAMGAASTDSMAADEQSFEAAYNEAEAARKAAAAVGFEWRDTAKMLKKAKEAAGKGDYEAAEKIAKKAKRQGELAVAQAREQEQAWRAAVLK